MLVRLLPLLLLPAACSHPVKEGVTLGEDPELLGPNITEEIRAGEFRIGAGDTVDVDVWDHPDLSRSYVVAPDGTLFCHLIGRLDVYGLTREELRDRLTEAYDRFLVEPSLDVTVHLSTLRKVTVLGMVRNPGVYPLATPRTTVLDMIATAGGIGAEGDTTGIVLARLVDGEVQVRSYNLDLLFDPDVMGEVQAIPYVQPGDYLYVLRTDLARYQDYIEAVGDSLRAIEFAERDLLLAPRVNREVLDNAF
ncbi:MAG: hypothetical protein D6702_04525 [Planctomycetota bacterium]|nr:MAG: hypothetical protein D6702_04525 [Planctomycetota bacterium]